MAASNLSTNAKLRGLAFITEDDNDEEVILPKIRIRKKKPKLTQVSMSRVYRNLPFELQNHEEFNSTISRVVNRNDSSEREDFMHSPSRSPPRPRVHEPELPREKSRSELRREKVKFNKEVQDMNRHKLKTFYALKPFIVQEYKQRLIGQSMELRHKRKCCYAQVAFIRLDQVVRHLARVFEIRQAQRRIELRRVWGAMLIAMQMRRIQRRRGPLHERKRSAVKQTLILFYVLTEKKAEDRAEMIMHAFLFDLAKKNQLRLKMRIVNNRILQLQKKYRFVIYKQHKSEEHVRSSIMTGLNCLRQVLIYEKSWQPEYKGIIEKINWLTSARKDLVQDVARMYLELPTLLHSMNLVRWYGQFRNNGKYNKVTYFPAFEKAKALAARIRALRAAGAKMCPPPESLTGLVKKTAGEVQGKQPSQTMQKIISDITNLFVKVIDEKDKQKQYRKLLQKRMANLFSFRKKLPMILQDQSEYDGVELNEEIIAEHFAELDLEAKALQPLLQPSFSVGGAYPDEGFEIYDLVCVTLAAFSWPE